MSPPAAAREVRVAFGDLAGDYRGKRAAIDAAVARVLGRGWFILGEEVRRFEEEFGAAIGVAHVVGCANGTEAIALATQEAKPGDIVLIAGKGHEKTQVTRDGSIPFDDAEVAHKVLHAGGYECKSSNAAAGKRR